MLGISTLTELAVDLIFPMLAWAALAYLIVRWLFRYWETHLASEKSFRLTFPVSPMVFLSRRIVIGTLVKDDEIQSEVNRSAQQEGLTQAAIEKQVRQYAREIVPSFKAVFYFSIGYWLARTLLLTLYQAKMVKSANQEYAKIGKDSTVVLFMNHRSNVDVLLINYLLSRHSAVSHAAGEWARLWPLHHLVKMAGNYVVDRQANDPLYRLVLKRYVQMSVANGIHLGIFAEGGLTRDGHIQPLNFGLLNYVTTASWPGQDRDVIFIPVSFNYDRVPEQDRLVFSGDKEFRHRSKIALAFSSIVFCIKLIGFPFTKRRNRFGWACASLGEPVSLKAWQRSRGIKLQSLSSEQKRNHIQALGHQLMGAVTDMIPVLPIHVLAISLLQNKGKVWSEAELFDHSTELQAAMQASGAPVFNYELAQAEAYSKAVYTLTHLGILQRHDNQSLTVLDSQLAMLHYYANSCAHYLDPSYSRTQVDQDIIESAQVSDRNKKYLSVMLESYERVLHLKNEKGFFERFYEIFRQSSPEVVDKFKHTDMARLQQHLKQSLEHIQDYFISGKPSERLRHVAQVHARENRDIEPNLYQVWLQSLLETVAEYDVNFDSKVELCWRSVMAPGIEYMCSLYDSGGEQSRAPHTVDYCNVSTIESQGIARWIDHWSDRSPEKVALISDSNQLTYGQLASEVSLLAGGMQQQLGINAGDRVAFLSANRLEFLTLTFACARIGAILVPINFRLSSTEQVRFIERAGVKAVFVETIFQTTLQQGAVDYQSVLFDAKSLNKSEISYSQLLAMAEPQKNNLGTMDSPLFILFTSGSTGDPKGAVLTQRSIHWNALNSRVMHDMRQTDLIATTLPFFHAGGINIQTLPAMQVGASVRVFSNFDAENFMRFIIQDKPNLTVLVPTQMQMLMKLPDWFTQDMSSLRAVSTGSTIVSKDLIRAWSNKGVPVIQIYGCTESGPIAVHQTISGIEPGLGTVGHAALYTEFRIIDNDNKAIAQGAEGEILLRGPNIMSHYWQDEKATEQAIRDGWLLTGDIGYQDNNGRLHIVGRKKRLVISGGENIHPAEIEQVLELHPRIEQAAVIGIADSKWDEIPVAVVAAAEGFDLNEEMIRDHLNQHLGRYKHPRQIFIEKRLPHTGLEKIAYTEVAELVKSRLAVIN